MRFYIPAILLFASSAVLAVAQSTAPVLRQSLPAQSLAPGGPAVTVDLRNYFAVPGIPSGVAPAPYDTVFPTGGGTALITLTVENSAPSVVSTLLSGSTLTLTPAASGDAVISVRARDPDGAAASGSFAVAVASRAPEFIVQPRSQRVAIGSTVVFNAPATGAAEYRWQRNGETIPEMTTNALVIANASAADAGRFTVTASNALGETSSDVAILEVVSAAPAHLGRLTNLSILTSAAGGDRVLTMGAVVGPFGNSGTLPVVVRAVGPSLAQAPFNVQGALADPVMTLYAAGAQTPLETNDNWGGDETLRLAFEAVAAFPLAPNSLDSALVRSSGIGVGGYTIQVTGKSAAEGAVLAEIYDAGGATRENAVPRLINVSTLAHVDANTDLTVGFVLAGLTARTVLVRGVGPSLSSVGVSGVMADPRLELFDNATGQRIGSNDDWSGALEIANAGASIGAFPLGGGTSKDAALIVTLPPGPYSARISGVGGTGGMAIVEVYEVP